MFPVYPAHSLDILREECHQITRYLVGQAPPPELMQRYIEAHALLLTEDPHATEAATIRFIQRHPGSLPYLDAVSAILRPGSLLRKKILVMIAILETTPTFTAFFFPEPLSAPQFFLRMVGHGFSSGIKFVVGCLLYPFAVNAR